MPYTDNNSRHHRPRAGTVPIYVMNQEQFKYLISTADNMDSLRKQGQNASQPSRPADEELKTSQKRRAAVSEPSRYDGLESARMDSSVLLDSLARLHTLVQESTPGDARGDVRIALDPLIGFRGRGGHHSPDPPRGLGSDYVTDNGTRGDAGEGDAGLGENSRW